MAHRKVLFRIVRDADDYPPVDIEGVWATETDSPTELVIANIPFFTRDATLGDTVKVRVKSEKLYFERAIRRSTSSLIRVIPYDATKIAEIRAELKRLGCSSEWGMRIIAVNIPGEASIERVQEYLHDLEKQDVATYEEPILRHPITH